MSKNKERNIFSLMRKFRNEESCIAHFKSERDRLGVACKCGHTEHYWIKSRLSYECKKCRKRMTLKSGTIMQGSNLSFLVWYKTIFLLSTTKKVFSSKEIQRHLGLKRYEPVWAMVHKLRRAMGDRDARYTLEGTIEMDEGYFKVDTPEIESSQVVRSRGMAGKKNVAILVGSAILEDTEIGKKEKQPRYFKAKVLETSQSDEINKLIGESVDQKSIVLTDKSASFADIANLVQLHITEKSTKESTQETLKWAHFTIHNAKRNLQGNYHKVKGKYLQLYLNEFIYKLNRKYFGDKLFDRLIIASITELR